MPKLKLSEHSEVLSQLEAALKKERLFVESVKERYLKQERDLMWYQSQYAAACRGRKASFDRSTYLIKQGG